MTGVSDSARDWSTVSMAWDEQVDYVDEQTMPATAALFDRVSPERGDHVLELAAGPGSLGAEWSNLVGPTGSVVLSDLAPGMVDVARRRNAHLDNVELALIDASAIDRPDDSFDIVACRMGLMFTPDPAIALAEIHRVLRDAGRLGVFTWSSMDHNPWMTCVGMAAMMHGLVSGPPIGPGGIFSLGDPTQLETLARGAGFTDVTADAIEITFRADDVDAHVERVSALAGPLAVALHAATPDQLAAMRHTAAELAAPYVDDTGVVIPGQALLLAGRA